MLTVSTKVYRHAYTTQFRARRSCVMQHVRLASRYPDFSSDHQVLERLGNQLGQYNVCVAVCRGLIGCCGPLDWGWQHFTSHV